MLISWPSPSGCSPPASVLSLVPTKSFLNYRNLLLQMDGGRSAGWAGHSPAQMHFNCKVCQKFQRFWHWLCRLFAISLPTVACLSLSLGLSDSVLASHPSRSGSCQKAHHICHLVSLSAFVAGAYLRVQPHAKIFWGGVFRNCKL